jgi:hypothetical protein
MEWETVQLAAFKHYIHETKEVEAGKRPYARYALSVQCAPQKSADELAEKIEGAYGTIRESTVGAIRQAGFDVVERRISDDHCLIVFPGTPTWNDYRKLDAAFGKPRRNPARTRWVGNKG